MSAHAARANQTFWTQPASAALRAAAERSWLAVAVAAAIVAACFYDTGGLNLGPTTTTELLLTVASGALVAVAATQSGVAGARAWGVGCAGSFFLLALFTALSVTWSVQPSESWIEASRTFSYAATFAGAVALARIAPQRWRSVIAGVFLATVVVAAYAIGTKIFPAGPQNGQPIFARLNAPFDYWNVVGVLAAIGVPPALWLGSRREGHGALVALAPPAVCLLLVTVMLCYSRGSLVALAVGLVFWFAAVPLRLRSASTLLIGGLGAAAVVLWTFSQSALTTDNAPLSARAPAGHELGWLLIGALLVCALAGLALRFATIRNPPSEQLRRRLGSSLVIALALVPIVAVIALAASSRGLFGSISHAVSTLTNTNVGVSNSADRLTVLGSQRALYWSDAIKAYRLSPAHGSGAGSFQTTFLRYDKASNTLVAQAHSYVFQTLADLGLLGLAISLVLAGAWVLAAIRTTGLFRQSARAGAAATAPERIGLLTMVSSVVIFTTHSSIDWTWFVPGVAMIAIILAGWVAGRGPHDAVLALGRPSLAHLREPATALLVAGAVAVTLVLAWSQWQPQRSADATNASAIALSAGESDLSSGDSRAADAALRRAEADARAAIAENPLDFQPLVWLAYAQAELHPGELGSAYATMVRAVRLQPANYQTWYSLALFDFEKLDDVQGALTALSRALYLYPNNYAATTEYEKLLPGATPAKRPVSPKKRVKAPTRHASSRK